MTEADEVLFQRTHELFDQATAAIRDRLAHDPQFLCRLEVLGVETVLRQAWRLCCERAVREQAATEMVESLGQRVH